MSQLVIKPGMSMSFDAAARHLQHQSQELVASLLASIDRIRSRLIEPGEHSLHLEPTYIEKARMSREMDRL